MVGQGFIFFIVQARASTVVVCIQHLLHPVAADRLDLVIGEPLDALAVEGCPFDFQAFAGRVEFRVDLDEFGASACFR